MRIIAWRTLRDYIDAKQGHRSHSALDNSLRAWRVTVEAVAWRNTADVRASYAHASFVGLDRVVFNIVGNSYRLVTAINYEDQIVFIKWIGTHDEYDNIDVRTVRYGH